MEQHSGSFFYHFFVVFFGGGILISLLIDRWRKTKASYLKYGFPLTYTLSFLMIFGLSATKLPHYSWPAWPALALSIGMISILPIALNISESTLTGRRDLASMLGSLSVILIGVFTMGMIFLTESQVELFSQSVSLKGVFHYFTGFSSLEIFSFSICASLCAVFVIFKDQLLLRVEACALFSTLIALFLTLGLARTVNDLMVVPFSEIAEVLKKDGAANADCIRYSGALSPTFSLALAPELIHNRCEPNSMKYLVAPEWKAKECQDLKFNVIAHKSYLILCKRG